MASFTQIRNFRGLARLVLREPLVLFMAIGLGLYVLYDIVNDAREDPSSRQITIDRQALLSYMQARAGDYGTRPEERLDTMSAAELAALSKTYAREEAMYREAIALGLDEGDYLVRQRLVQSLRFLFRNLGESGEPSAGQLQAFYAANPSRYAAPATITFSHIFFDAGKRGPEQAEAVARATMTGFNARRGAPPQDAVWPGDRFAYNLNYSERDEAFIASHFGTNMARRLFSAKADERAWQGPFRSDSGFHVVRIERHEPGRLPLLEQVRDQVLRDYREMQGAKLERSAIDGLVQDFDVSISPELRRRMEDGPKGP